MKTFSFKEQLGYPLLAFLLWLFVTSVEGAIPSPPPATQAEVNAGTGTYKYVTPATLAGWSGTPTNRYATNVLFDASGFNGNLTTTDTNAQQIAQKLDDLVLGGASGTGMKTNTFTTFSDGQWQLFTDIPDGSLCFSNLTYPQFVLMLRTNGSLLLTNSTTGASNVMSAAGWSATSGSVTNGSWVSKLSNSATLQTLAVGGASARILSSGYLYLDAGTSGGWGFTKGTVPQLTYNDTLSGLWWMNSGLTIAGSLIVTNTITGTNGFIVSSNSWANQPTLAEGQAAFLSSNGVPHVVWKVGGVLTTNNLTATGAADGVGISTNGGSGTNNPLTTPILLDNSGVETFRPGTREIINSAGAVMFDGENANLNSSAGNELHWSSALIHVFNDFSIGGHLTTPAALVTNTPATDEVLVYSSPTTAKSTASLTLTSLNVGTAGGNGRALTNLNGGSLFWNTNGVTDITLIDLTKTYAHTNHTANFTISGFTTGSYPAGGTNYPIISRWYTNNSVGAKTITLPASWLDLGIKGNPVYNTNFGVLSLWIIPGSATNYLWVGR